MAENNFFKLFRIYREIHNSVFLKLCISTKIIKSFEKNILEGQKTHKFFVLEPDLKARVLDIKSLIPNIDIIDYKGFVKLAVELSSFV